MRALGIWAKDVMGLVGVQGHKCSCNCSGREFCGKAASGRKVEEVGGFQRPGIKIRVTVMPAQ